MDTDRLQVIIFCGLIHVQGIHSYNTGVQGSREKKKLLFQAMYYYRKAGLISYSTVLISGWPSFVIHHGRGGTRSIRRRRRLQAVRRPYSHVWRRGGGAFRVIRPYFWLYRSCLFAISVSLFFLRGAMER